MTAADARGARPHVREPWHVVGVATLAMVLTTPGQTAGVSVLIDPVIAELEVTRSQVSTAYMVGTLLGSTALPMAGRAIDRLGVRAVMALVGGAFGVVAMAVAGAAGLLTLALGFVGLRALGQGSLSLTATTAVAVAFRRRRGTAMGLTMALGSALMGLAPLALAAAVGALGWRLAWLLAGVVVVAAVVPLALLGLRGVDRRSGAGDGDGAPPPGHATRAQAVCTPLFWAITGGTLVTGLISTGLQFHQISLLTEQGLSPQQAAANFAYQSVALVLASLATGWLADRASHRVLVPAAMAALAAAMVVSQVVAPGALAGVYGVLLGTAAGSARAYEAAGMPRAFGTTHIGAIRGVVMAVNVAGTALGPIALSVGFDLAGTYAASLYPLLALPLAVSVLALRARPPAQRSP